MTTAVSSMESVGRVMHSSDSGSEGLGLGGGSVLSLVRLGDGLVRDLAGTTVDGRSVDKRSSVDNRGSVVGRGSVDNRGSVVSRSSVHNRGSVGRGIGIGSSTVIGDLSHVSVVVVHMVVDMLGAAVRKSHGVRAFSLAGSVARLSSVEVGVGVVVSDGIVVCVGGDLVRVDLGRTVSRGGVGHNRGVVGRGGVGHNWGVVGRGGVNHRGGVNNRGNSMGNGMSSDKAMSYKSVSSNKAMSYQSVSCDKAMTTTVSSMESVG